MGIDFVETYYTNIMDKKEIIKNIADASRYKILILSEVSE